MDFVKAIKVYKEIGYEYMLMPDHVPHLQRTILDLYSPSRSVTATFAA